MSVILAGMIVAAVILALLLVVLTSAVINSVPDIQEARGGPLGLYDHRRGEGLPAGYGIIPLPAINWSPDGTKGATKAVTGTSEQWMNTTLKFQKDTENDWAFIDFYIPPDFSTDENLLKLYLLVNCNDTNKAHKGDWNGTVRRVPVQRNESDDCVVADAAGTAFTANVQVTDDTALEVYTVEIDLGGKLDFKHLDLVQFMLYYDIAGSDLGADPYIHSAFAYYKL
jgi:hypothetical protein